ncbi:MAG: Holliday junction branch migration protein RuvA [Halanaerobiales bacterium]
MIGYLKGHILWSNENEIIINVNGVGYQVEVTDVRLTYHNKEIELYIYTYVREDTLALYGFKTLEERKLFITLLGVSGIGPKAASNILSSLPYDKFINAILTENVAVLKQISGIGPKTAQRLILELKSKIEDLAVNLKMDIKGSTYDEELYDALIGLGYSATEIDNALAELNLDSDAGIEEKIKKVLSCLGKER